MVLVLAVIVAKGRAIEHGAEVALRVLVLVVIAALSVAVAAGATAAVIWYRRRTVRPPATRAELPVIIRRIGPPGRAAIEAPHLRADVLSAAELAEVRRAAGGDQ